MSARPPPRPTSAAPWSSSGRGTGHNWWSSPTSPDSCGRAGTAGLPPAGLARRLDQVSDLAWLLETGEVAGGLEREETSARDFAGVGVPLSRSRPVLVPIDKRDREGYRAVVRAG